MQIIVLTSSFASRARSDQKDNLVQAGMVVDTLSSLGFEVNIISATLDMDILSRQLDMLKPGLVFNLVEEIHGKGAFIHFPLAVLENMNIPFTGNGHSAMVMTSSKLLAKKIMLARGIPTPEWLLPDDLTEKKIITNSCIIKSVWEHGSYGLGRENVFREFSAEKIQKRIRQLKKKFQATWFVEKYIPGRELNVSILETRRGPEVLPVAEIIFEGYPENSPEIVDYQAKWNHKATAYKATRSQFVSESEDNDLIAQVKDTALKCWKVFELSGYARVDFRVDSQNMPYVLEINTNPCISLDAGFMAAALKSGLTPVQTVNAIVQSGLGKNRN